jgi:hypothetical protein
MIAKAGMKRAPAMASSKMKFSKGPATKATGMRKGIRKGITMSATRSKGQRGMAMRAIARKK